MSAPTTSTKPYAQPIDTAHSSAVPPIQIPAAPHASSPIKPQLFGPLRNSRVVNEKGSNSARMFDFAANYSALFAPKSQRYTQYTQSALQVPPRRMLAENGGSIIGVPEQQRSEPAKYRPSNRNHGKVAATAATALSVRLTDSLEQFAAMHNVDLRTKKRASIKS